MSLLKLLVISPYLCLSHYLSLSLPLPLPLPLPLSLSLSKVSMLIRHLLVESHSLRIGSDLDMMEPVSNRQAHWVYTRKKNQAIIPEISFLSLLLEDEANNWAHQELVDHRAHQKEHVDPNNTIPSQSMMDHPFA